MTRVASQTGHDSTGNGCHLSAGTLNRWRIVAIRRHASVSDRPMPNRWAKAGWREIRRGLPPKMITRHTSLCVTLKPSHDDAPATLESIIRLLCGEPPDCNPHPRNPARFNRP